MVGVGLIVGLSYDNLKVELSYLIAGGLLFLIGQGMIGAKKR